MEIVIQTQLRQYVLSASFLTLIKLSSLSKYSIIKEKRFNLSEKRIIFKQKLYFIKAVYRKIERKKSRKRKSKL
jgi:hypothetical protein